MAVEPDRDALVVRVRRPCRDDFRSRLELEDDDGGGSREPTATVATVLVVAGERSSRAPEGVLVRHGAGPPPFVTASSSRSNFARRTAGAPDGTRSPLSQRHTVTRLTPTARRLRPATTSRGRGSLRGHRYQPERELQRERSCLRQSPTAKVTSCHGVLIDMAKETL
jgi:hypothetical protein